MVKCSGNYGSPATITADMHVIFFFEDEDLFTKRVHELPSGIRTVVELMKATGDFTGKDEEMEFILTKEGARILLVGVGEHKKFSLEMIRRASARAAQRCKKYVAEKVAMYLIEEDLLRRVIHATFPELIQSFVEGALLSLYSFDQFKAPKKSAKGKLKEFQFVTHDEGHQHSLKLAINRAVVICEGVELARNYSNLPVNKLSADVLAKEAASIAKKYGMKSVIFKKADIEQHKMGGLLAVNQGSKNEPRFIILEYNLDKRKLPLIALVGKGVMFDTGGISIKPSASMDEMKMDMSGGAAVIATMQTIARLKIPMRVVGIVPATDNMPSGSALCPGDIITISNGKTVEVLNTDAEGRLILSDGLVYAQRYKPHGIIDLATLTGACVVALGAHATGMMGTSDDLKMKLKAAGEKTYERVCELPLYDEFEKQVQSEVADVKNLGGRWGGAITAGMFLKHFVGEYPWVHLDIAGTAMLEESGFYAQKGGSGVGVRLLVEFLTHYEKKHH